MDTIVKIKNLRSNSLSNMTIDENKTFERTMKQTWQATASSNPVKPEINEGNVDELIKEEYKAYTSC